jgi:hypothetical protein
MKKIILGLIVLAAIVSCTKETAENTLELSGNIKGLKTGTLYIQKFMDSTLVLVDSITFNGKSEFKIKIPLESPEMLYLFLDKGPTNSTDNSLFIFAEPGKMYVDTQLESFYSEAKVTGSKNHELYLNYKKVNEPFNQKNIELINEEIKALKLERPAILDSIQKEKDLLVKRRYLRVINFALNHKEYEIAPYVAVFDIYDAKLSYLDSIQKVLTPKVAEGKYGIMLKNLIEERKEFENE